MESPLISTILCVRDGQAYLAEALDSILRQQVARLETIVIDDGSSDGSAAIAAGHPLAVRLFRQSGQGLPTALNNALQHATGEFITFLDADDVWPANRLGAMLDVLAPRPELDGVYGRVTNSDSELRPLQTSNPVRMVTAMMLRREAIKRVGSFRTDVAHAANLDWISRADVLGLRLVEIDQVVLLRRIHGENMGVREKPKARHDLLRVVRDHHRRMGR